jgi:DNA repair protein RadC
MSTPAATPTVRLPTPRPPTAEGPTVVTWAVGPPEGRSDVPAGSRCSACTRSAFVPAERRRAAITSPEAAAEVVVAELGGWDRERCVALLLDTKHRLLEVVTVSVGSIDHTFMAPREVYRDALLANASALVLAHNHPSGDPEPSRDDELVTRRLRSAGELVGVELLDHLVVGGTRWVSLARRGAL